MEGHADDLERLVRALDLTPPYYLSGVAAGAAVALLFASRRQDEIGAAVFCAPALGVDADRRRYLMERSSRAATSGMRSVIDASLAMSFPPESISDPKAYEDYRAGFLSNDPISYGLANAALADFTLGSLLEDISYPVLVLAGRHDRLRPPTFVEALARRVTGASFSVLQSGHLMPVQAPQAVAQAILGFCCTRSERSTTADLRAPLGSAPDGSTEGAD